MKQVFVSSYICEKIRTSKQLYVVWVRDGKTDKQRIDVLLEQDDKKDVYKRQML